MFVLSPLGSCSSSSLFHVGGSGLSEGDGAAQSVSCWLHHGEPLNLRRPQTVERMSIAQVSFWFICACVVFIVEAPAYGLGHWLYRAGSRRGLWNGLHWKILWQIKVILHQYHNSTVFFKLFWLVTTHFCIFKFSVMCVCMCVCGLFLHIFLDLFDTNLRSAAKHFIWMGSVDVRCGYMLFPYNSSALIITGLEVISQFFISLHQIQPSDIYLQLCFSLLQLKLSLLISVDTNIWSVPHNIWKQIVLKDFIFIGRYEIQGLHPWTASGIFHCTTAGSRPSCQIV